MGGYIILDPTFAVLRAKMGVKVSHNAGLVA
jgi:hypothetical protein